MNGENVRVWHDRWIPSLPLGHPIPPVDIRVSRNLRVNSLFDGPLGMWDIDFLKPFISVEEYKAIVQIRTGDHLRNDRLVWPKNRNGVYTVRSGYHWVHSLAEHVVSRPVSFSLLIPARVWKTIWKLKTPPKIHCFVWKTFSGALATMKALFRHHCALSLICPICHSGEELIEHMLLVCSWVEAVWFGGSLGYRVDRTSITSMASWFSSLMNLHLGSMADDVKLLSYVAFTWWHIRKTRCEFIFNQKAIVPRQVLLSLTSSFGFFPEASLSHSETPSWCRTFCSFDQLVSPVIPLFESQC